MADVKFIRMDSETDPDRCQGLIQSGVNAGQCQYKAVPGCKYCIMHGGGTQAANNKKNALKNYQLTQYAARVGDLSNSPDIKSLREEIGILRLTLENVLNQCENANKLLLYTDKITNLTDKINKLVVSCQNIEEKNNNLLDRKVVIVIADSIVTLISEYISDPDKLLEIGDKICGAITTAGNGAPNPIGAVA
jgi:hypothetical protein